jgi:hypothetical protein
LPPGGAPVAGFFWCSVTIPLVAHADNLSPSREGIVSVILVVLPSLFFLLSQNR